MSHSNYPGQPSRSTARGFGGGALTDEDHARYEEKRAIEQRVAGGGLCCEAGKAQFCVCRRSVKCPTHGTICIGSHD